MFSQSRKTTQEDTAALVDHCQRVVTEALRESFEIDR